MADQLAALAGAVISLAAGARVRDVLAGSMRHATRAAGLRPGPAVARGQAAPAADSASA